MKNNSITAAKGIGIILVVIGHILEGVISPAIFTFHMPFFFILSGIVYKAYANREFTIKKTQRLVYPYIFYSLLFFMLGLKLLSHREILNYDTTIKLITENLKGGPYLGGWQSVFWFVSVIYLSLIAYNILVNILSTKKLNIVIIAMLFFAYIYSFFFNYKTPFDIGVCLFAIPLIHLGHHFKAKIENLNVALCIVILSAYVVLNTFMPQYLRMDMKYAHFGIPFLSIISSLSATRIILWLAKKDFIQNPAVLIFGECSMLVMYLHQYIRLAYIAPHISNKVLIAVYTLLACFIVSYIYRVAKRSRFGSSIIVKIVN